MICNKLVPENDQEGTPDQIKRPNQQESNKTAIKKCVEVESKRETEEKQHHHCKGQYQCKNCNARHNLNQLALGL